MSDLISREAAVDLIDEYLDKSIELHYLPTGEGIKALIFALPSAQPEQCEDCVNFSKTRLLIPQSEIIRCKECKYGSPNGKYGCKVYHYRKYETHEMNPDDFCSRAERRTNEQHG